MSGLLYEGLEMHTGRYLVVIRCTWVSSVSGVRRAGASAMWLPMIGDHSHTHGSIMWPVLL